MRWSPVNCRQWFLGLRGTTPEMTISDDHYPATYIAGLYNTAASEVAGQVVENEDFVNAPDNQHIALKIGDTTDWLTISPDTLQQLHRQLNLKTGLFVAEMILKDADNQQIKLTTKKSPIWHSRMTIICNIRLSR